MDAIVNAANESLLPGGGVSGAIHRAAGPMLFYACRDLGGCEPGEAKITEGYDLKARYVIHTVGPMWEGGDYGEAEVLARCYQRSLTLAVQHGLKTIAFPAISTGVYDYPPEQAAPVALRAIQAFLATPDGATLTEVRLVCFDPATYAALRSAAAHSG